MAAPVPMNELFSNEYVIPRRPDGVIEVTTYPSVQETCFMLPCILCLGCFVSSTTYLVIKPAEKKMFASTNMGYCWFLADGPYEINFSDIANVGYINSGFATKRETFYSPVIVTKTRAIYKIGQFGSLQPDGIESIASKVLAFHKLFFGDAPGYVPPALDTLLVVKQ